MSREGADHDIAHIDEMLTEVWGGGDAPCKVAGALYQMSLKNYRELCTNNHLDCDFLKETTGLPESVVIQLSEGGPRLLTDEDGYLLEFA